MYYSEWIYVGALYTCHMLTIYSGEKILGSAKSF